MITIPAQGDPCDATLDCLVMPPTLRVYNARFWTPEPARPWVGSITIENGRVLAVNDDSDADENIDAAGRTVTPGLIDAHLHMTLGGQSLGQLDLSSVRSRRQFEAAIARRHGELARDQWLIARGWSNENWPARRPPEKSWLAAAGNRPVVCHRMDMHAVLVNDAVLDMCDTSAQLPGGCIVRDPVSGTPTGLMVEAAAWKLVNPLVPEPDESTRQEALLAAQDHLHGHGVTSVGTMEYRQDVRDVFVPLRQRLTMRCRITLLDRGSAAEPADLTFARDFSNDERLAIIGYKAFIDGTLGSRTARMLADYADDPGNRGLFIESADDGQLRRWAQTVAEAGLSPAVHAIGDEAVRLALDAIDDVDRAIRPRIEHAQHIDATDFRRFRGRIASMQPLHKADDGRYVRRRLGDKRLAGTFAFRRLLDAGARLAFGSDWPVVSCDPRLGIRTAVTGLTFDGDIFAAEQNLTVAEALRAYTVDAAYALGLDEAGQLRPGALGDMVMFDRDPFQADWAGDPPRVVMTIVGGQVVHDAR